MKLKFNFCNNCHFSSACRNVRYEMVKLVVRFPNDANIVVLLVEALSGNFSFVIAMLLAKYTTLCLDH